MKNKLLTSTSIGALLAAAVSTGSAYAADEVSNWTGLYVGVHVGATIPDFKNNWNPGLYTGEYKESDLLLLRFTS